MTWRLSALVGTIATLGFVAGIRNVWEHRPPGVPSVMFALHHPHYLRPYHPSARLLFASLAVGAVCLAAAPLLRARAARGARRWHWCLLGVVLVAVAMVGGGLRIYKHPPNHRACYIDVNQTAHTRDTICRSEPDKLLGRTAARYLIKPDDAPFMILAFEATEEAGREVPAVVHVDNTMRCQTVDARTAPRYHALLEAFERQTGAPVLLNTSFNVKGEAIVCTPRDAIRCFSATGLDALVIGAFVVEKPRAPLAVRPDDVLR